MGYPWYACFVMPIPLDVIMEPLQASSVYKRSTDRTVERDYYVPD